MRSNTCPECSCAAYRSPNSRRSPPPAAKGRVIDVADAGEKVVLDLEIQPANEPGERAILAGEIDGRCDLVCGPALFYFAGVRPGQGKSSRLHTMCQLKHDAEPNPEPATP